MTAKTKIRRALINLTGYWIYKLNDLPTGCDLSTDLKLKLNVTPKTIFDVGANIGQTAIAFSEEFPEARVFSFEPVSNTFNDLKKNTGYLSNVTCHQLALGDKEENVDIKLFEDEHSVLNSLNPYAMNTGEKYKLETISVTTGDKFCTQNGINTIDLLKIDTEGYEIPVLKGFSEYMLGGKIKTIYCEVGFNPDNKRNTFINDLILFATQKGYFFYGIYGVSNVQISTGKNYGNLFFVHKTLVKKA